MDAKEKRFVELSWRLLECKCYHSEFAGEPKALKKYVETDQAYDAMEDEYKALAEELGRQPTASDMVGFEAERPSCQLVVSKFSKIISGELKG